MEHFKFETFATCIFFSDLIEGKSSGILSILDEESKLPKPSYTHFTESVHKTWPKEFKLGLPRSSKLKLHRSLRDDEGFLIKHFAGAVCYQTVRILFTKFKFLINQLPFRNILSRKIMMLYMHH